MRRVHANFRTSRCKPNSIASNIETPILQRFLCPTFRDGSDVSTSGGAISCLTRNLKELGEGSLSRSRAGRRYRVTSRVVRRNYIIPAFYVHYSVCHHSSCVLRLLHKYRYNLNLYNSSVGVGQSYDKEFGTNPFHHS